MIRTTSIFASIALSSVLFRTDAIGTIRGLVSPTEPPDLQPIIPQPVIFDTDYGPFIDDTFALGLLLNSGDLLDLKYVVATSELPDLSAKCIMQHLDLAGRSDIPVGSGTAFPDYSLRGGMCAIPGLMGFALEEKCNEGQNMPFDPSGVECIAIMLDKSDRDDWWYIVVGGQSSLQMLVKDYPDAANKISTVIVMGGNWCTDFQPFPGVDAPTDETNIACDPGAANFVLDGNVSPFDKIYYVPVAVADVISGVDYSKIVQAANEGKDKGAAAMLDFYRAWSAAGRADPNTLIHGEAMKYDPETESAIAFDSSAVMLAIELLQGNQCDDRMALFDFEAIHFLEVSDPGLQRFPSNPRSAFSLIPKGLDISDKDLPQQCPNLTEFDFDPIDTPESEKPVTVFLGFSSQDAKASVYAEMAERMAGIYPGSKRQACFTNYTSL